MGSNKTEQFLTTNPIRKEPRFAHHCVPGQFTAHSSHNPDWRPAYQQDAEMQTTQSCSQVGLGSSTELLAENRTY